MSEESVPAGGRFVAERIAVGLYAWIAAVLFGAILLDVGYAASVPGDVADIRDLLLGAVTLTILAGIAAVAASWRWRIARLLLLASLALVAFELLAPAMLSRPVGDLEATTGVRLGPWIRLAGAGGASLLALAGCWEAWRRR